MKLHLVHDPTVRDELQILDPPHSPWSRRPALPAAPPHPLQDHLAGLHLLIAGDEPGAVPHLQLYRALLFHIELPLPQLNAAHERRLRQVVDREPCGQSQTGIMPHGESGRGISVDGHLADRAELAAEVLRPIARDRHGGSAHVRRHPERLRALGIREVLDILQSPDPVGRRCRHDPPLRQRRSRLPNPCASTNDACDAAGHERGRYPIAPRPNVEADQRHLLLLDRALPHPDAPHEVHLLHHVVRAIGQLHADPIRGLVSAHLAIRAPPGDARAIEGAVEVVVEVEIAAGNRHARGGLVQAQVVAVRPDLLDPPLRIDACDVDRSPHAPRQGGPSVPAAPAHVSVVGVDGPLTIPPDPHVHGIGLVHLGLRLVHAKA
mmetsp:Transcript_113780/g.328556  ORF Transcript_113780/g.328556 Transcript_113780/m.328556 type:complete len:378 (-) Transcript_113780:895-2028(-)